jgi:hypothetical protein
VRDSKIVKIMLIVLQRCGELLPALHLRNSVVLTINKVLRAGYLRETFRPCGKGID